MAKLRRVAVCLVVENFVILLRVGAPEWPRGASILNVPLATINTAVLISSSVTMVMAWASLMRKQFGKFRLFMGLTVLLGGVFLVIKYFEYVHKFEAGLLPGDRFHPVAAHLAASTRDLPIPQHGGSFFGIYFMMTGVHGLHVIIGIGVMFWIWLRNQRGEFSEQFWTPVDLVALYWHLVDLIWIFLFPLFYLIT